VGGCAVESRQDITAASQQESISVGNSVRRRIGDRVEHAHLSAGAAHRFLVVRQLAARGDGDQWHAHLRAVV